MSQPDRSRTASNLFTEGELSAGCVARTLDLLAHAFVERNARPFIIANHLGNVRRSPTVTNFCICRM